MNGNRWFTWTLSSCVAFCLCFMLIFPQEAFDAAVDGIAIWWNILFPALFPFFVLSELLLGFGIVHGVGCLLDPIMRPWFKVPGVGGFVMAIGFASGYPVGARMTLQLWNQKLLSPFEASRLLAFTTTADPIFLVSAVCLGFFHDISLAGIILFSHYTGAIVLGVFIRILPSKESTHKLSSAFCKQKKPRFFQSIHQARLQDGRTPTLILGQAIQQAITLVLLIGGLVTFFSVFLTLLRESHVLEFLERILQELLLFFHIPPAFSTALLYGIFEVTLGTKAASEQWQNISSIGEVAITAFILSWAGFCVHAQIFSTTSTLPVKYWQFAISRFIHGCISALLVFVFWHPMQSLISLESNFLPVLVPQLAPHISLESYFSPLAILLWISFFIVMSLMGFVIFAKMLHVLCKYLRK